MFLALPRKNTGKLLLPLIGLTSSTAAVAVEAQEQNSVSAILQCQARDTACQTPCTEVRNQAVAAGRVLSFIVDHLLQKNESLVDVMIQKLWTSVAYMLYR